MIIKHHILKHHIHELPNDALLRISCYYAFVACHVCLFVCYVIVIAVNLFVVCFKFSICV